MDEEEEEWMRRKFDLDSSNVNLSIAAVKVLFEVLVRVLKHQHQLLLAMQHVTQPVMVEVGWLG